MAIFTAMKASYRSTYTEGILLSKQVEALNLLKNCTLCPRKCRVNRLDGQTGICRTGRNALVSSYGAHFGEEPPLVGRYGSGTIFFTHCNLLCNFCQNYDISHEGKGAEVTSSQLAVIMLRLQNQGCHNINFVTPTHVVPQIIEAVYLAAENGLSVPLVYNSSGYDSVETLRLLDGIIDIYMPDFKFWNTEISKITCGISDYPQIAKEAVAEMHRQVGDLVIDKGVAKHGLLLRHLVLPENKAGTDEIMAFVAGKISNNTYVNIMNQYRPCYKAREVKWLSRKITTGEYDQALEKTLKAGLHRISD